MSERILAKNISVSNDCHATQLNNNDLIIGVSGSGKTRSYVMPNLLQQSDSFVVIDTKGNLHRQLASFLEAQGYEEIMQVDLTGRTADTGYNPLDFVARHADGSIDEQAVMAIAQALIPDDYTNNDRFWDDAARMLLTSLIAFLVERYDVHERNLADILTLVPGLLDDRVDEIMGWHADEHPDSFACRKWNSFYAAKNSDKMMGSIAEIMTTNLEQLLNSGVVATFIDDVGIFYQRPTVRQCRV